MLKDPWFSRVGLICAIIFSKVLAAGQDCPDGTVPFANQTTQITGTVVWDATPVPNATVELENLGGSFYTNPVLLSTVADGGGNFTILNPPTGSFTIYAVSPSAEYWSWVGTNVTVTAGCVTNTRLSLSKIMQLLSPPNDATVLTTTPTFQWAAFPGTTYYVAQVFDQVTLAKVFSQTTTATGITIPSPGLPDGSLYQWSVDAYDGINQIAYYSASYFWTAPAPAPDLVPAVDSLFDPLPGALFTVGQTINVQANVSAAVGGPAAQVQFMANGVLIGPGVATANNTYAVAWTPSTSGQYSLTSVATDFQNNTWTGSPTTVAFNPSEGPAIWVISPAGQSVFNPGDSVQLTAFASAGTSPIQQVEFFLNGASIGLGTLDSQGNYDTAWTAAAPNSYSVFAQATDGNGNVSGSQPITIYSGMTPVIPLLTIASPADGSTLTLDNPVAFTVAASALGAATVSGVNLFANGSFIGTATPIAAPDGGVTYTFTWIDAIPGGYLVTATAIDSNNQIGISQGIGVTILPASSSARARRELK